MISYLTTLWILVAQEIPMPSSTDPAAVLSWLLGLVCLALGGLWAANAKSNSSSIADLRSALQEERNDKNELVNRVFKIQETTLGALKDLGHHVDGTNKAMTEQVSQIKDLVTSLNNITLDIKSIINHVSQKTGT